MARKSMKRRNKRRGTSKMQNQQFSRKLFKAIAKGLTRKQKIFGGANAQSYIVVTSPSIEGEAKRTISVVFADTKPVNNEGFSSYFINFAKEYYNTENKGELKLSLPAIFDVVNGVKKTLIKIKFDNDDAEYKELEKQISATAPVTEEVPAPAPAPVTGETGL